MQNEKGATLIELVVVIFFVVLFSAITIFSFQEIQERLGLSRAAHKMSQDLREAMDLSLSGLKLTASNGVEKKISGYGVYFNKTVAGGLTAADETKYSIYADTCYETVRDESKCLFLEACMVPYFDYKYTLPGGYPKPGGAAPCIEGDYIVKTIDIDPENRGVYVKSISSGSDASINFTPPTPSILIKTSSGGLMTSVEIVLGLKSDDSLTKTILVNSSGLIEIKAD